MKSKLIVERNMIPVFKFIYALDSSCGFSKNGRLPWNCKEDMRFFAETTIGKGKNAVVMGRKTWDSIPEKFRPLKNRLNVVLTKSPFEEPGVSCASTFDEVDKLVSECEDVWVIGGVEILKHYQPKCESGFITRYQCDFECDQKLEDEDDKLFEGLYGPFLAKEFVLNTDTPVLVKYYTRSIKVASSKFEERVN